jgi:hypothetical protein
MARDAIVNVVMRLMNCGYDPRRVAEDAWESRCPAHRGLEHSLAISRNELSHVLFDCRSEYQCEHSKIVGALGMTNEHLYTETPPRWIARVRAVPFQTAAFGSRDAPMVGVASGEVSESPRERTLAPEEETRMSAERPANGAREQETRSPVAGIESPAPGTLADFETATAEWFESADGDDEIHDSAPSLPALDTTMTELGTSLVGPVGVVLSSISLSVESGERRERRSSMQVLANLAAKAQMFRSPDGRFCAQVPVGDRLEIFGLRSAAFRDWLIDGYLADQPEPPSNWAIRRVIGALEAKARFTSGVPEVFVRVGQHGDEAALTYFLDLGDSSGRAVAIRDDGWRIVDRPGVHFRRPEGLLSMPAPVPGGSIELLRPYVNLSEADFRLMIGWLTAALRPVGPYPVLVLNGEQAAGKSTLARILRMLIDPQACPSLALPKSTHDLLATAVHGWLLVYENISTIPGWFSDCVCQLAFGGGYASRQLFSDGERSIIYAQRPVMLVGIDDFVVRGDLRDRAVFLNLQAIPEASRRTERSFWPAFQADYPTILGGVLDAIVGGLRALPSVNLKRLPRMADYAEWGEAVSHGLEWASEAFLSTYQDNRKVATESLLDDSPVAPMILAMTRLGVHWSGTPEKLYQMIAKTTGKRLGPRWPSTVSKFSSELRRIVPQLWLHGLSVSFERNSEGRIITLHAENSMAAGASAAKQPRPG